MITISYPMIGIWLGIVLSATSTTWNRSSTSFDSKLGTVYRLEDICQAGIASLYVKDAITFNFESDHLKDFVNSTNLYSNSTDPAIRCQITFNLSPENGASLVLTMQNHLPINR